MAKRFKVGIFDHMDRGTNDTAAFFAQRLAREIWPAST
jgi:hypothetical protein